MFVQHPDYLALESMHTLRSSNQFLALQAYKAHVSTKKNAIFVSLWEFTVVYQYINILYQY